MPINDSSSDEDDNENSHSEFNELLADVQPRLRGYIISILGNSSDADDLVQETNMVLLLKRTSYTPGTSFIAWAFQIAYYKATTWRRDRGREAQAMFKEETFQKIAAHAEENFAHRLPIHAALAHCVEQLPASDFQLVEEKYAQQKSLKEHAMRTGRTPEAVRKQLSRIRLVLRNCINQFLKKSTYL